MPFFVILVFFAVALAGVFVGMRLYVRPKEALERVVGGLDNTPENAPPHPSLAFHDLVKKLGNFIPQSPKDVTVMQRRLIRAGIRKEGALRTLYGAKFVLGVGLPLITAAAIVNSPFESGN